MLERGGEEEEEEEGLAWRARQPAPSHCLPWRSRGHVGQRGEAGEGTRRGGLWGERPPPSLADAWALGEHKARSPALRCVPGSLPRNKEGEGPPVAMPGRPAGGGGRGGSGEVR